MPVVSSHWISSPNGCPASSVIVSAAVRTVCPSGHDTETSPLPAGEFDETAAVPSKDPSSAIETRPSSPPSNPEPAKTGTSVSPWAPPGQNPSTRNWPPGATVDGSRVR